MQDLASIYKASWLASHKRYVNKRSVNQERYKKRFKQLVQIGLAVRAAEQAATHPITDTPHDTES